MSDGIVSNYQLLIALGCILLLGLAADAIGKRTVFPRVTLLLVFGIVVGEQFLDLIPVVITRQFDLIANITLLMVGFLLGGQISPEMLKNSARKIISISFFAAFGASLVVFVALLSIGVPATHSSSPTLPVHSPTPHAVAVAMYSSSGAPSQSLSSPSH